MNKLIAGAAACVAFWVTSGGWVRAQGLGPNDQYNFRPYDVYSRPYLSPYLNLLRGGDPAANYYLGVLPEMQRRAFLNRYLEDFQYLYQRTNQNRDLLEDQLFREPLIRTLPPTGHPTGFMNYGTYFNLNRR
jgi:hypothetical protein